MNFRVGTSANENNDHSSEKNIKTFVELIYNYFGQYFENCKGQSLLNLGSIIS